MKHLIIIVITGMISILSAQSIPNLPVPIGAGTAEAWNGSIYFFGGSGDWNGTMRYPRIYKYDGVMWSYHDSIPDYNVWDVKSVQVGDEVYLLSGWPNGSSLIRKYHLPTGSWTYLAPGPNTRPWGCTAEHVGGFIYLLPPGGQVYEYDIGGNTWTTKSANSSSGYFGLGSAVYQDEIYVAGFENNEFHKYTPASDTWTRLADIPDTVIAGVLAVLDDKIYCVGGGSDEEPIDPCKTVLVYNISTNSWAVDRFQISGKRQWMADARYQDRLYVLGGFDSTWSAVEYVEEIVPQGPVVGVNATEPISIPAEYSLGQNYPNPFNPTTNIGFRLPAGASQAGISDFGFVSLKIYDVLGREVATLVNEKKPAGSYIVEFDAGRFASGEYFYRIAVNGFTKTRRMLLAR